MHFSRIPNAAISKEADRPLMQKEVYPVSNRLQTYLQQYKKDTPLLVAYKELMHYEYSNAIKDANGKHTYWEKVVYEAALFEQLKQKLIALYRLLSKEDTAGIKVISIDFCEYANSMPFRINLVNTIDNTENCFYIKSADASRIYGLELEQLLTHNRINFLYHQNTLVEEHIDGMPGDDFLALAEKLSDDEKKAVAIEFIRFNERCFARLLGDMRSYNFVVIKNDDDKNPFTIKAIDFDQQCYEGRLHLYLPQFYKENLLYVQLATGILSSEAIEAIRMDERKELAQLATHNREQLLALLNVMADDEISDNYKVLSLRKELDAYFGGHYFKPCKTMGAIVKQQLQQLQVLA